MAGDRYYHEFRAELGGKVELCSDDVQQGLHLGIRCPLAGVRIATMTPEHARLLRKMLGDALAAIGEEAE